jgi:hypothetical protein
MILYQNIDPRKRERVSFLSLWGSQLRPLTLEIASSVWLAMAAVSPSCNSLYIAFLFNKSKKY